MLAHAGYRPGPANGLAGSRTHAAIRAYQRANGLTEDGQVTPKLAEHLARWTGVQPPREAPISRALACKRRRDRVAAAFRRLAREWRPKPDAAARRSDQRAGLDQFTIEAARLDAAAQRPARPLSSGRESAEMTATNRGLAIALPVATMAPVHADQQGDFVGKLLCGVFKNAGRIWGQRDTLLGQVSRREERAPGCAAGAVLLGAMPLVPDAPVQRYVVSIRKRRSRRRWKHPWPPLRIAS